MVSKIERNNKGQFTSKGISGSNNYNWIGGKVSIRCANCGKELLRLPCRLRRGKNFCNRHCKAEWQTINCKGNASPSWKGGRRKDKSGYIEVYMPAHHRNRRSGYVYEHILVAEEKYGEPITKEYHVHHLNGIKDDNRPENLVRIRPENHKRTTVRDILQQRIRELEQFIWGHIDMKIIQEVGKN